MYSERGLCIAGAWRRHGGSRGNPAHDPATGEVLGTAPAASAQDTQEAGKSLAQSRREWQPSLDRFRWYAEEARRVKLGQVAV